MSREKLIELVKTVAVLRQRLDGSKEDRKVAERAMLDSEEGKVFQAQETECTERKAALSEVEEELRTAAIRLYNDTADKDPIEKVRIKLFKELEYDKVEIENWCRTFAPGVLIVDKKKFEKSAEAIGAPVKVNEVPRCTIGTDLSMYLQTTPESDPDFELAEEKEPEEVKKGD